MITTVVFIDNYLRGSRGKGEKKGTREGKQSNS